MAHQVTFRAKIPTWPEDVSRNCSPWRTAQLNLDINTAISLDQTSLAGINFWYAREEEEDFAASPWWEEAGMAALSAQGYGQDCPALSLSIEGEFSLPDRSATCLIMSASQDKNLF